jgi:nitrogen regulatory protein PII-like uncharacterized protein
VSEQWTFSTLKEHFDALRQADKEAVGTALAAAEKAVTAALTASEKAILKAENASDKRLENLNELRGVVTDQQRNFANKEQTELRLKFLEDAAAKASGKSAGTALIIAYAIGGVGIAGTLFTILTALGKG